MGTKENPKRQAKKHNDVEIASGLAIDVSTLIRANEISHLISRQRGGFKYDDAEGVKSTLICGIITSAAISEPSGGEVLVTPKDRFRELLMV
ncbi:unnamed protein product [Schistocephalus solidus]|uniref:Polyribonucleotide nucleotidyltransferase n=1 Tax=Schistocephalus solidus TaxID=70667 RepID=A0A183T0H3_SCHSO|nr:unnamed protein product [Schistocephalus solidus]